MNKLITQAIGEEERELATERVTFRISASDQKLIEEIMERLKLKQSAVIRVAIRALEKQTRVK